MKDEVAWSNLVNLYSPLVLYWCKREGIRDDDAFEVGQEVFVSINKSLEKFQKSKNQGSFRGWVRTITKRRVADFFRAQEKQIGVAEGGSVALKLLSQTQDVEIDLSAEKRILYQQAWGIVKNEFNETHQQAFRLLVIDQWKAKDVAEKLGTNTNTVYMARHHILKRLREEFSELLE